MTINPETLRRYRDGKGLSQAELAEVSGVSKKTISRIERGQIARTNQATGKRLAKALDVKVEDLAKQQGEREAIERDLQKAGYRKLKTYIDSQTAVAYALVQHRYGVSPHTLIEMAPLFFTILAEGSLAWRRRKVEELRVAVGTLGLVADDAPHLAFANAGYRADEALSSEEQSIAERDIFGAKIDADAFNFGFDPTENNPFADYLRLLCRDIDNSALEIDLDGRRLCKADDCMPDYRIAPAEFEAITGDDIWAKLAIERGHVRISEIPEELMAAERRAKRIAWIASRIPEEARKEHQLWLDGLPKLEL